MRKQVEIAADEDEEHLRLWAASRQAQVEPKTDGWTGIIGKLGVRQNRGALLHNMGKFFLGVACNCATHQNDGVALSVVKRVDTVAAATRELRHLI